MNIDKDRLLALAKAKLASKQPMPTAPTEPMVQIPQQQPKVASAASTASASASASAVEKARALLAAKLAASAKLVNQDVLTKSAAYAEASTTSTTGSPSNPNSELPELLDRYGNVIQLNEKQAKFVQLARQRESCVLIGAAGTGKTTCTKAAIAALIADGIGTYQDPTHSKLTTTGTPAIVGCAYTRIAVANLAANMPKDMQPNCLTIHALLEYRPFFEDYVDEKGIAKTKMYFDAYRNANNPLCSSIKCIIIDESSMLDVELFRKLLDAIQHPIQFIFLGDINQLPPVFGSAILGFAMNSLATVELTEVYRNAGAIVQFAHRILSGKPIPASELESIHIPDVVKVQPWKKRLSSEDAAKMAAKFCVAAIDNGAFDPDKDIILCPYNKAFGTIYLNQIIANHVSVKAGEPTYEIIAGFKTAYLAVGDKVLYEKEPATVVSINPNMAYQGRLPTAPNVHLDRQGFLRTPDGVNEAKTTDSLDDLDALLDSVVATSSADDGDQSISKRAASHVVTVRLVNGTEVGLDSAGEINDLLLGYALTVHKSQGSEWRRVLILTHHSHNTMLGRELMYTAVTRAKESVHIIGEPDVMERGISTQRILGNTLAEKAEYFKGKAASVDAASLRFN